MYVCTFGIVNVAALGCRSMDCPNANAGIPHWAQVKKKKIFRKGSRLHRLHGCLELLSRVVDSVESVLFLFYPLILPVLLR